MDGWMDRDNGTNGMIPNDRSIDHTLISEKNQLCVRSECVCVGRERPMEAVCLYEYAGLVATVVGRTLFGHLDDHLKIKMTHPSFRRTKLLD
jgi:hypothetical protein